MQASTSPLIQISPGLRLVAVTGAAVPVEAVALLDASRRNSRLESLLAVDMPNCSEWWSTDRKGRDRFATGIRSDTIAILRAYGEYIRCEAGC